MPYVYIPLDPASEKAPGFYRSYITPGLDIDGVCARQGWASSIPPDCNVYDEAGGLIQAAPKKEVSK